MSQVGDAVARAEGDWKDFTFKRITPSDYPEVLAHLASTFCKDEAISKHLGQGELKTKDFIKFVHAYLEQGISFMVTHKPTQKIAGVRVMGISRKEDHTEEFIAMIESTEYKEFFPTFLGLIAKMNIYERLGLAEYGDLLVVSVSPEFRQQGLASEMYNRTIEIFLGLGITAVQAAFTSPHTQRIARQLGFEEVVRMRLKDCLGGDGKVLMPDAGEDEQIIFMIKRIS